MIDTLSLGKQSYVMCQDIAEQLNFSKTKTNSGSSVCLIGGIGEHRVIKKHITLSNELNKLINYVIGVRVVQTSADEQFEVIIKFDDTIVSRSFFVTSNGCGSCCNIFNYTSSNSTINLSIAVCSTQSDTSFFVDQIIISTNTNNLKVSYPNKCIKDKFLRFSLGYLGEGNYHNLGKAYNIAFEQDGTLYAGVMPSEIFDIQRLNLIDSKDTASFCAYSTCDGLDFGIAMLASSSDTKSYNYNHKTATKKSINLHYYKDIDVVPCFDEQNSDINCQAVYLQDDQYVYYQMKDLVPVEGYSLNIDSAVVKKLCLCKPKQAEHIVQYAPIVMLDTSNKLHIYHDCFHMDNSFEISVVDDMFCVYKDEK